MLHTNDASLLNSATLIFYELREAGHVQLEMHDVSGRKIKTLVSEWQEPGIHRANWNGQDDRGVRVSSGVYCYSLKIGEAQSLAKILCVK